MTTKHINSSVDYEKWIYTSSSEQQQLCNLQCATCHLSSAVFLPFSTLHCTRIYRTSSEFYSAVISYKCQHLILFYFWYNNNIVTRKSEIVRPLNANLFILKIQAFNSFEIYVVGQKQTPVALQPNTHTHTHEGILQQWNHLCKLCTNNNKATKVALYWQQQQQQQ